MPVKYEVWSVVTPLEMEDALNEIAAQEMIPEHFVPGPRGNVWVIAKKWVSKPPEDVQEES